MKRTRTSATHEVLKSLRKQAKEIARYYEQTKTQMGKEKEYEIITKLAEHLVEILRIQMLFTSAILYTGSLICLAEKQESAEDRQAITKMKEEYERRVKEDLWTLHQEIVKMANNPLVHDTSRIHKIKFGRNQINRK